MMIISVLHIAAMYIILGDLNAKELSEKGGRGRVLENCSKVISAL